MKLAILAGGKGTRLGFSDIPKPMVKVTGRPILEHQILLAKKYGIKDIFFLSGYLADHISNYFGDGSSFGVNIHHIIEEKPLGTAGAIKLLENKINDRFLVFYGDVILDFDIESFIEFDKKCGSVATIVVHPNDHPYDSDLVETDHQNIVTAFHSKPHREDVYYSNLVNAAIYILSPEIFSHIRNDEFSDFGKDIFPALVAANKKIYAYNTPEYIKDMGTPDRLKKVEADIISGKVAGKNLQNKQKAVFLDRDGVMNYEVDHVIHEDQLDLIPGAPQALKNINKSDYLAVLVTNQPAVAKGFISEHGLKQIHNKLEHLLGLEGAYLDRIYYCPHHPDKGFQGERIEYKIDCECRKPKTGMIRDAQRDLNIDIKKSFIIGDSFRDILCGRNAGLTTIAVRTGKGLKDKYEEPDYFFDNLSDAVNFIINEPYLQKYLEIKDFLNKKKSADKQHIISIGGLARSGKTILSKYLSMKFTSEDYKVLVISLDNWILSKDERKEEHNVFDRFQIDKINNDFTNFFNGRGISIQRYSPLNRGTDNLILSYNKEGYDIIIIDGIVALRSNVICDNSDLKIFCDIDGAVLYSRFINFYRWKGLTEIEIEKIYRARVTDEYNLIKNLKEYSDIIINLK